MIKILICDDDREFPEKLRQALRATLKLLDTDASIHIHHRADEIPERLLSSVDIAFLDIDFEEQPCNGIDIARKIRKTGQDTVIIFVTNYIEYAPEGYEVQAFRYLLKSDLSAKLDGYLRQAIEKLQAVRETIQLTVSGEPQTFALSDILYIEAQTHTAVLYLQKPGQREITDYRLNASLKSLEDRLAERGFLRIQKSYVVNMRRLRKLQCAGAELDNGTFLPVSEKHYAEQKKRFLLWKGRQ